jgi:hypothetical protein
MNVLGVRSSFFHACCSETQNNELGTISPQLLMAMPIGFLQGAQEKQLTRPFTGLKKRCSAPVQNVSVATKRSTLLKGKFTFVHKRQKQDMRFLVKVDVKLHGCATFLKAQNPTCRR